MNKNKKECIKKMFDGVEIKIVKYDFLPPKTVGLSTDLYHKLKEQKDD